MAKSYIGTGHGASQTYWRVGTTHEAEFATHVMAQASTDQRAAFHICSDLTRSAGDTITAKFSETSTHYTHNGFNDADSQRGQGQSLEYLTFSFVIDYLSQLFEIGTPMSLQRLSTDQKADASEKLAAWWADRWDVSAFNQLAGITHEIISGGGADQYNRTGMNQPLAVDSGHVIYSPESGTYTTDEGIGADDEAVTSLRCIDELTKRAMSSAYSHSWRIPPEAGGKYKLYLHPEQGGQLRDSTDDLNWGNLERARVEGGKDLGSTGFQTWSLGEYANTQIFINDRIPLGVTSTDATSSESNCRRAVFVGARALVIGFGKGYGENHLDWTEDRVDVKKWAVAADSIFGMSRVVYTGSAGVSNETFGNFVLSTYSAA